MTIWPILGKTQNAYGTQYSMFLCTLSYPCLLIRAMHCSPLSIMVYTTCFTSSLIASIREDGMACGKYLIWLGNTALLLPRYTVIFFHAFDNFETLKQCHFVLMPNVNISRVNVSWMAINLWKFFPWKSHYMVVYF